MKQLFSPSDTHLGVVGFVFGLFYWLTDAIVMVVILDEGTLSDIILSPDKDDIWMRCSVMVLSISFGLYAQRLINHIRQSENQLRIQRDNLEEQVVQRTSELEVARDEAELSSHAKGLFLATMSHEIRTPMNGVLGMAEIMGGENLTAHQLDCLDSIKFSGKTLLRVINDILDDSKVNAGKIDFEMNAVNLREWMDELVAPHNALSNEYVDINVIINPNVPLYLKVDPARLHQIIGNLISNGVKFTRRGSVTISIDEVSRVDGKSRLLFKVIDSGIGLDKESQSRIFNDFEQAKVSIGRDFGGTGLGLSICKRLVAALNGQISVESELGKGSTFIVALDLEVVGTPIDIYPDDNISLSSLNILLVDDNVVNQKVAMGMFKKLGINITTADNGQDAVDFICNKKQTFDLVFMDCEMPILNGYEATRQIRAWEASNDQPAISICALTAHAMQEHVNDCKKAGMDYHLAKPLQLSSLRDILLKSESLAKKLVD